MKARVEPAPGQRWAITDKRYEGWRYVTVLSADEHFVVVKGRRTSRIRAQRFGGPKFMFCGHDGPGILPPYASHPLGCLNAGPPPESLSMRRHLDPGFGCTTITRDGVVVLETMETDLILAHFERRARAEPGDWRLCFETPLRETLYQRQGPSNWVLVAIGMGFA